MKYLKEYNEIDNMYMLIDYNEFMWSTSLGKYIQFTNDEMYKITSIIPDIKASYKLNTNIMMSCKLCDSNCDFLLYKTEDEWYYIFYRKKGKKNEYYKCDQIQGLQECLTMIKNDFMS